MTKAADLSLEALTDASLALISDLQDRTGAYPASPTFSAYKGYSWFRDGSFIADGMSAAGARDSAEKFFAWCAQVVTQHRGQIEAVVAARAAGTDLDDAQMLPTRFHFDGRPGADDWWDFQLDGYGTWLWALDAHRERYGSLPAGMADAVALTVDYLTSTWDRPCYDWWEEHTEQIHVSTLGCVGAGLEAAITMGILDAPRTQAATNVARQIRALIATEGTANGHLTKWLGSTHVDASLLSLIGPIAYIPAGSDVAVATLAKVEADLAVNRGVHRFVEDTFFGGGQWPLLSCFAGLAHHAQGNVDAARDYLSWAAATATDALHLPEQVADHLLAPERQQEWIDKWGPVATPLLWAHAMFLRLNAEVGQ